MEENTTNINAPEMDDASQPDVQPLLTDEELHALDERVINMIKTCFDPEIPVNIYEMGLIYEVRIKRDRNIQILMTLTSPSCPAAQSLPAEVRQKVQTINGVGDVTVEVVWDPPWTPNMMSEAAKLELGFF